MESFKTHRGIIALLDRGNIDTDQIIPKQFLKSIKKTGYGEQLFYGWRYLENGQPNPEFELNAKQYKNASILVAGNNFGCGSSREHAVWAVVQYGFKVIIAPSFADIFKNNSIKNGLLTIELEVDEVNKIKEALKHSKQLEATIDLSQQKIILHKEGEESIIPFEIDPAAKKRLVEGLDDIGLTLQHEKEIKAFEEKHNPQIYG